MERKKCSPSGLRFCLQRKDGLWKVTYEVNFDLETDWLAPGSSVLLCSTVKWIILCTCMLYCFSLFAHHYQHGLGEVHPCNCYTDEGVLTCNRFCVTRGFAEPNTDGAPVRVFPRDTYTLQVSSTLWIVCLHHFPKVVTYRERRPSSESH